MTEEFKFYLLCLVAVVIVFLVVKKITGCALKIIITLAVLAALAYVYLTYFYA